MTTRDEWIAKAIALFGDDAKQWRFVCPVCETEQSINDFIEHTELPKEKIEGVIAFSCIGRWARGGCEHPGLGPTATRGDANEPAMGCDYAGGGLFRLNPVRIEWNGKTHQRFAFAGEGSSP
jgi:hypothetical protein